MPFIDRSTLTYPATNSFPIRKWLDPQRNPTSNDYKNFQIFDIWINDLNNTAWIMVDKTATSGTWLQMASSSVGIGTINNVPPDGGGNLTIAGTAPITISNSPGTNTVTIGVSGVVATSFPTQAGTAIPAAGALTINGAAGITTSGAGSTVTITAGPTVPTTFTENAGSAMPALNNLNILGTGGITTSGAGSTVTITAGATIPTTFTADAGSATPAANNLNIFGAGSTTTSGAGSTITINSTGGGISWNEITVVGPTQMAVNMGYVANNGATVGLTLPLTAAFGSVIWIVGKGSGGWQAQQNAGQTIINGAISTTVGVTGTLTSSEPSATGYLLCITANTTWKFIAETGNLITV